MATRSNLKRKSEVNKENKKPPVTDSPKDEKYKETTEEEKALFQGQDHIEVNENPNSNVIPENPEIETTKQNVISRPRETYLKEKLSKIETNHNLISNIKKVLKIGLSPHQALTQSALAT